MNITKENFKYFTVYETTNIVNGKKYVGMHATNNIEDNYIGSGRLLKAAIKKYGKESFKKEILHVFDNFEDMAEMEKMLCNEEVMNSTEYYNLKEGGAGGVYSEEVKRKIAEKAKGRKMPKESIERGLVSRKKNGNWYKSGEDHHMYGKSHSKEVLNRISENLKEKHRNGHKVWNDGVSIKDLYDEEKRKEMYGRNCSLENNPSYGSKWLGNVSLGVKCYIKKGDNELEKKLKARGWEEKPKNFNSLKSVTKIIEEYL